MYSHVTFDLDGTLVDSLPGIASALNAALNGHQLPTHNDSIIRAFIGDGSYTLCERAAPQQEPQEIKALHSSFIAEYSKTWKTGTHVYTGIEELIAELKQKGCKLSILSNKPHTFTTEIVDHFFPEKPFDLVLGQRDDIRKKPDPSGVHEILGELEQSSSNSVLVGDSTVDIITARNAGIQSTAVTWGYHSKEQLKAVTPKHTAHTVEQLLEILTPKHTPAFR